MVQIHPGPVVTTFEFKPDAGVKYAKVTSLADDLSLALKAESVLIERIPGKSTVGIQIPNTNREQISLRDILESDVYRRSGSKLTLAMGKTIHGEPYVADLATMPHLLVAGSTGTGKSVAINSMLTSILYRATPDDVRLIMIDPKRLELGMYEEIPHLLTPVVVDPKQAANALAWAVHEMEERYKTLAAEGVRNIDQYNRNIRHALEQKREPEEGEEFRTLPYIVVVIDELADLMMVASSDVEESIARLAQMARAVGIHLILATQRPSVDVVTGLIKANLPARVSFRLMSKVDSRTILDGNGAEQLLGRGDMLFLPPASSRLIRLHGPYISEQESARLAAFLRKQAKPVYDETITVGGQGHRRGRVRQGRPVRRGGTHRRRVRPGLDFLSPAPPPRRVQPRGQARGHDGSRRARLPRRGQQAARGARRQGLLRRSGQSPEVRPSLRATVLLALLVAPASHAGQRATASRRRSLLGRREPGAGACARPLRKGARRSRTTARWSTPSRTWSGSTPRPATWTMRCGAAPRSPARRSSASATIRDRATARRMLALLASDYPLSPYVPKARDLLPPLEAPPAASGKPSPPPPGLDFGTDAEAAARPHAPYRRRDGDPFLWRASSASAPRESSSTPGTAGTTPEPSATGVSEADVVLDVAIRLEALLAAAGVDVVLTRRSDEFIPLDKRTAIATREQADLFLSIHANASRAQSARGVETYVLNFATDSNAEAVAARENASTEQTISSLPDIVRAIALHSKLDESRSFAGLVQRALVARAEAGQQGARGPRRQAGAVRRPRRRGDAECPGRSGLHHESAGGAAC